MKVYAKGLTVEVLDKVVAPPAPTITNFIATPASLPVGGGPVTFNATVANATTVTLDGLVVTLPVTRTVTASKAYVLVASGPTSPAATASVAVAVSLPAGGGTVTTGGVSWLDPLGYTKPKFIPLTHADEGAAAKYYLDFSGGAVGAACTMTNPGKGFADLVGKSGMAGGPAFVYVKGSARLDLTANIFGAAGLPIVVKPWAGLVNFPTAGTGQVQGANTIRGPRHVIFDGGPSLLFDFNGVNSANAGGNGYVLVMSSSDLVVARSRIRNPLGYGPNVGIATGSGTNVSNVKLVNCEVYDNLKGSGASYGIYTGGGTGCGAGDTWHYGVKVLGCVFRNIAALGILVEPRSTGNDTEIAYNAFRDIGMVTAATAVSIMDACGGSFAGAYVRNNLMFNLRAGGVQASGPTQMFVENNAIWDYAKTAPAFLGSHGVTSYSDGQPMTVRNNAIIKPNASEALPLNRTSGWTQSGNVTSGSPFLSTDVNSPNFLKTASGGASGYF